MMTLTKLPESTGVVQQCAAPRIRREQTEAILWVTIQQKWLSRRRSKLSEPSANSNFNVACRRAELLEKFLPELRELSSLFQRRATLREAFLTFVSTGDIQRLIDEVCRNVGLFALEGMVARCVFDRKQRRERLPDRRESATFDFEFASLRYACTHASFADGRIGEVFLNNHRHDSASDMWARDGGILASLALQYGAPLDVLRNAIGRGAKSQPTSPIGAALDLLKSHRDGGAL
jgi:hypothetical protein